METAKEALNSAMENGATLEEANEWLALTLAKTTIQLHPNSNQLDPANVTEMASNSLDIKRNRKTAEAVEKVIRNAREKHIHVYTTIENIITEATAVRTSTKEVNETTTKIAKGNMSTNLWEIYKNHKDSKTKIPVEIEEIKTWCKNQAPCPRCYEKSS